MRRNGALGVRGKPGGSGWLAKQRLRWLWRDLERSAKHQTKGRLSVSLAEATVSRRGIVMQEGIAMRAIWLAIGAGAIAALAGGCSSAPSSTDPPSIVEVVNEFERNGMQQLEGGAGCPQGMARFCSSTIDPESNCTCVDSREALDEMARLFNEH
jgi:hypothetical protein